MKRFIRQTEESVSVTIYLIMVILAFSNVLGRYVLHTSISYTEEITTNLFVLVSVMGTGLAARDRAHLGLSVITELMSKRIQLVISVFANLCGAVFGAVLLGTGIQMVINQYLSNVKTITLQWPAWIYGLFLPVGAAFIVYNFVIVGLEDLAQLKKGESSCD